MSTKISKLYLQGEHFLPISAAEAVLVNGDLVGGLGTGKITTLDKVLAQIRSVVGLDALDLLDIQKAINILNNNYSLITAGNGIELEKISLEDGSTKLVISNTTLSTLFVVNNILPTPSAECLNKIYIIPTTTTEENDHNTCNEYVCIQSPTGDWSWETLGSITIESSIKTAISGLESRIITLELTGITAYPVYKTDKTVVSVDYTIPDTLYDE